MAHLLARSPDGIAAAALVYGSYPDQRQFGFGLRADITLASLPPVGSTEVIVWTFPSAADAVFTGGLAPRPGLSPRLDRLARLAASLGADVEAFRAALARRGTTPLALRAVDHPSPGTATRSLGGVRPEPWAAGLRAFTGSDSFRRRRPKRITSACRGPS